MGVDIPLWTPSTLGRIHVWSNVFRHWTIQRLSGLLPLREEGHIRCPVIALAFCLEAIYGLSHRKGETKQSVVSCWVVKWKIYLDSIEEKLGKVEIVTVENIQNSTLREKWMETFKRASIIFWTISRSLILLKCNWNPRDRGRKNIRQKYCILLCIICSHM